MYVHMLLLCAKLKTEGNVSLSCSKEHNCIVLFLIVYDVFLCMLESFCVQCFSGYIDVKWYV